MRSMTFLVNDRSTGGAIPAVAVTITENSDGSLSFSINVLGRYTGDLRGFFFDLADESRIGTLTVTPTSEGFTEFRQGNDSIKDLGNGANMQGLLGSDGGYDAGIEIGTAGTGKDDYQSFSFTLTSSAGPLTLEDFSNVDFGLRLTSVGWDGNGCRDDGRDGSVKLLEHTSGAIDALDDANAVAEDQAPNPVGGNVFANDVNLQPAHFVTAVNGSAWNVGHDVEGTYGTMHLHLDGTYTYTLDNTRAEVQALAEGQQVTETFSYTAKSFDEFTSFSTDSALLAITITGTNDAPEITGDVTGEVFEDGSRHASGQLVATDVDQGNSLTWSVIGSGPMTPWAEYRFLLDNLNIVRNGVPFFNDDFGAGGPPPAAPAFNYFTAGTFLESGGRAIMDGGLGSPFTLPIPGAPTVIVQVATLNTDTGPDVTQGLKREQDFRVEARFDLVIPEDEIATYSVRFTDGANDIASLDVRRMEDGSVAVALREVDVANTAPVILAAIPLEPAAGDNQIVLRLEHAANSDLITASFDLLNGGVVTHTESFAVAADIFSNEGWTRVQIIGQSPATPQNGVYGTLSVEVDGQWHYSLNNAAANVQALAQGEHVSDIFTVSVTDEHGASDTQTLTIDVAGSNDAPIITGGSNGGFVAEDTPTSTASGQLFASDVDHGAVLSWSAGQATIVPTGPSSFQVFGYSPDYHFTVDQLTIERNGVTIFDDPFADGIAPPSAPNFSNGTPANYLTNFARFSEAGDRLILDGSLANAVRGIGNPELTAGHIAVLATNVDPADLTRGLKSDDDFTLEARFDLVTPGVGQGYGLSLTDNTTGGLPPDQLGDDGVNLFVRADADGNLSVQFNRFDIPSDTVTLYQSLGFTPQDDETQIVLRLIHDDDQAGVVHAEFDLLGAGGSRTIPFTDIGHIFGSGTPGYAGDDENWTRAQIVAFGPDAENTTFQGTYGSLSVQEDGQWTYSLDNGLPAVQALALGQFAQDVISVRATDEHGLSSFRPVFISVQGSNDPVTITGGDTNGNVQEDTIFADSGAVTFTDVDLSDFHNAFFTPSPGNTTSLGSFNLGFVDEAPSAADGSVGWTYSLNNSAAQSLAQGQTVFETYTVTVQDFFGASAMQDVTIAIAGINDDPDAVDDVIGGMPGGGGALRVAVIGTGSSAFNETALQLDSAFDADAISMSIYSRAEDWITALRGYDVVVVGSSGFPWETPEFESSQLFPALSEFVDAGGGVVTTGWFTYDLNNMYAAGNSTAAAADHVSPVARGFYTWTTPGTPITIFDPLHPIAGGLAGYTADTFQHELTTAIDPGATSLAAPTFDPSTSAMAYDEVGGGLTAYLGGLYLANVAFYGTGPLRSGVFDQLLEQAVAWTGGQSIAEIESNNTLASAQLLSQGQFRLGANPDVENATTVPWMSISGRVGPDNGGANDVDMFRLDLNAGQTLTLDIDYGMPDLDSIVHVFDAAGNTLAIRDDFFPETVGAGGSVHSFDSYLTYTALTSGTHYFSVSSFSNFAFSNASSFTNTGSYIGGDYVLNVSLTGASGGASASTTEDEALTISAASLLANDDDVDVIDVLSIASVSALSARGASVSLDLNGNVLYNPTGSAQLQALNDGDIVTDTFTYTVSDGHGGTDPATVTLTVAGVTETTSNTPPVPFPDDNTGDPVIEAGFAPGAPAGDAFASGNVLANDLDPDPVPGLHVTAVNGFTANLGVFVTGTYGAVQILADGSWNYTLDDFDFDTNTLAQGEAAFDQFTYTVSDQQGASATTTLTVAISGTNDFPTLEPVGNTGDVTEDGQSIVGGQLVGSDPDHGAILTFELPFQPGNVHTADYLFGIDHFTVTRFRPGIDTAPAQILDDDFGDGVPPPSGVFANGNPAYFSTGVFTEAGDRALMDGGVAQGTFAFGGPSTVGHTTLATTNTGADLTMGLRATHDFDVMGRFDAELPQRAGQAYGIALTDQRMGFGGDDHIQLLVRHDADGVVRVVLREGDAAANSITPIESIALDAVMDGDQIVLHLAHDLAQPGTIVGSFELFHGTDIVQSHTFAGTGQIFGTETLDPGDDELFTRAMFLATSPTQTFSRTGIYGTLVLDESGAWQYFLNNADPDTQALGQNETAIDSFDALAVDQFRTASLQPIQVTVHGANDAPVAVSDVEPAQVSENEIATINVLGNDFDVDGDAIRVTAHDGVSFYGATISLNPDGTFDYDPTTASALQNLNDGEVRVDTFTYAITDEMAVSLPATVSVTVSGVTDGTNTPPDITGGTTSGLVFEDGAARTASGQLTAIDIDPGSALTWSLETLPAFASSVGVNPLTGQWTYTLNNNLFQTQQLAQEQTVIDSFAVRVADEHGAFDTQVVDVTVTGTNDRPNFPFPPPPPPLAFSAVEDGGPAGAQTSAFDIDNFSVLHWSLNRGSALGYFSDYEFRADSFSIEKNGAPLFHDEFDAGGPPPSAPSFIPPPPPGGSSATIYTTTGNFQEVGGKLVMRGSDAFAFRGTGNDALVVGSEAILATNVDPANTVSGLKMNHQFVVEGVFDLVTPQLVRQAYGLTLTDGVNQIADDLLALTVRLDPDDEQVYVTFADSSSVFDTRTLVEQDLLVAGGADQIRLILSHEADASVVSASYELLMGGVVTGVGSLGQAGIFGSDTPLFAGDNENWIRAGLFSNGIDPREFAQGLTGTYGTLTVSTPVQNNVAELVYTPGAGAQALGQGQSAVDSFFVRAVDQYGMSTSQRVDVTVTGVNDLPVAVADGNAVIEDVVTTATGNVLTNDFDPDSGTTLTVATPGVIAGTYGTLTLNTNGSYEYLLNSAAVDFLQQGQVVHDIFDDDYGITDGIAVNFDTRLDIAITGTADAVVPSDGEVFEDGSRHDSGAITPEGIDLGTTLTWSVTGSGPMTPRAEYRFLLDNLNIFRDGATFFNDDFGAGGPPPAAPAFGYFTFGTFLESGGRAIMDAGLGSPSTLPVPGAPTVIAHVATLITDTGPDITQGLKREQDFRVEARYDLVAPDEARENYAVRFGDGANDIVEVCVRRMEDGSLAVALREVDVANTIPVVREAIPLAPAPGDNQIVLRLEHAANTDLVTGSFDLLNGGVVTHTESFATAATIFSNEGWTRAQIIAQSVATPQNGVYGTLSVEADGEWHYSLNNATANVQALAQGEHVTDPFTVTVTDGHGMTDTQTVTVAVVGSDDTPIITGPSPTFQNGAYVVEDGLHQIATGQFTAFDVDHGATLHWSASRNPYSSNYSFALDDLLIGKNGAELFHDAFDAGGAPPSAPSFANGAPTGYLTNGAGFSEPTGSGRAILDGAFAGASRGVGVSELMAGHLATLASSIDPADLTRGLRSDDDFTVEARYDLAIPGQAGQSYGVGLSDNVTGGLPPDQLGDDLVSVEVARNNAGEVVVRLVERDVVADQFTTLESAPFAAAPGEDQIVLRLEHLASQPGVVHASFDVVDDGLVTRHVDFGTVGHIFGSDTPGYAGDDENWTRVQLQVLGPDQGGSTVQGTFGTLNIDPTGRWTYILDNDAANVQALPQGFATGDLFSVRVNDEYGLSTSRPLSITVVGTGDGPPFPFTGVGGPTSDILVGMTLSDSLTGAGAGDLLVGLEGSDLFDYNSLADGNDLISDFTPGPGGDALDLYDLLINYVHGSSDPAQFVQLQQINVTGLGLSTQVLVNADGMGTDTVPLAVLHGVSELSLAEMIINGNLILQDDVL